MATWRRAGRALISGAAAGAIIAFVHDSVASIVVFKGGSMMPTIVHNDVGICDKTTAFKDIRRGDIVIASSPKQPLQQICKRVVALEGDEVSYTPDTESYEDEVLKYKNSRYIPRGHVWLEGDNKANSVDSRSFGPVPLGLVKSRVIGKLYPFRNATIFAREPANEDWAED